MARKNIVSYPILVARSLAASFQSVPTFIQYLDNVSYQINVTTTNSTGTFAIQASNDYAIDEITNTVTNPGNWMDLTLGGGTPAVAAANALIAISMNQVPFKALRIAYTAGTPGTGICSAFINCRQLGG